MPPRCRMAFGDGLFRLIPSSASASPSNSSGSPSSFSGNPMAEVTKNTNAAEGLPPKQNAVSLSCYHWDVLTTREMASLSANCLSQANSTSDDDAKRLSAEKYGVYQSCYRKDVNQLSYAKRGDLNALLSLANKCLAKAEAESQVASPSSGGGRPPTNDKKAYANLSKCLSLTPENSDFAYVENHCEQKSSLPSATTTRSISIVKKVSGVRIRSEGRHGPRLGPDPYRGQNVHYRIFGCESPGWPVNIKLSGKNISATCR